MACPNAPKPPNPSLALSDTPSQVPAAPFNEKFSTEPAASVNAPNAMNTTSDSLTTVSAVITQPLDRTENRFIAVANTMTNTGKS